MTDSRPLASSHLVTFLYKLARDHVPFGVVEKLVDSIEAHDFLQHRLSEPHVASWAESVAARLALDPSVAIREYVRRGRGKKEDMTIIRVPLTALPDWARQAYKEFTGEGSPQSPTAASADDVAARPPVVGLTLAEAQEADYILVVKGDTIKFLKDKHGNPPALDLVDPKEAYEITKEGARCRDTPGAVNPYPANTMKSQLHSQGWLTRDLQLCLARSNPAYRAQQLRGGSITEEGIRGGYGFESHTVFVEEKA